MILQVKFFKFVHMSLDDTTAMNICIQFEKKTGIEIDYRNLNTI